MKPAERVDFNDEETARFLTLLGPSASVFTFQTFDDDRTRKNPALTRIIHSPPEEFDQLLNLNGQGAGIFVTINETDGRGRKSKNITGIRAVWQEDDDGFEGVFPLQPSIVVETSPGHSHRYWLLSEEWPADEQGCADFKAVEERMVESYGSDNNAKDTARVMRLPGFLHRKSDTPHLVRIVEASGRRYSRAEILVAFPPVKPVKKTQAERTWTPEGDDEHRIRGALYSINADDRERWLQCGMAIKDHFGDSGRSLWDDWSRRSDKYDERDQERIWKSFNGNGIHIGTLFFHAQRAGWIDEKIHQFDGAGGDGADCKDASDGNAGGGENGEASSWDRPDLSLLDDRRGELPSFPHDVLSLSWQGWAARSAHGAGTAIDYVIVPLLGIASSLIGTARRLRASTSWSQPFTLWTAQLGFSGAGKTPGMDVTLRTLSRIERNRKARIGELRRAHESKVESAKAAKKQ